MNVTHDGYVAIDAHKIRLSLEILLGKEDDGQEARFGELSTFFDPVFDQFSVADPIFIERALRRELLVQARLHILHNTVI